MSNTFTKGYADGSALTEAQLDTAYQTLQLDVANTALATTGSTTGQALLSNGSGIAASFQTIPDPQGPFALRNYGLKATAASGVLVISLKTKALADPSGSDKVDFNYSTNGTTSASYTSVQISAATSISINASATLGIPSTSATAATRIFVYGYYNTSASAIKLAVSRLSGHDCGEPIITTAISASADNNVIYATASLTVVPRLLGHITVAQSSAGAWQTPTKVNITNSYQGKTVALSNSSAGFSTASTGTVAVTNLTKTVTTSGKPVFVGLVPDTNGTVGSYVNLTAGTGNVFFKRGTVSIGVFYISGTDYQSCPQYNLIDTPVAGNYTYSVSVLRAGAPGQLSVVKCRLAICDL